MINQRNKEYRVPWLCSDRWSSWTPAGSWHHSLHCGLFSSASGKLISQTPRPPAGAAWPGAIKYWERETSQYYKKMKIKTKQHLAFYELFFSFQFSKQKKMVKPKSILKRQQECLNASPVYLPTPPGQLHLLVWLVLQTFQAAVQVWLWHFVCNRVDSDRGRTVVWCDGPYHCWLTLIAIELFIRTGEL